MLKLTKSAGIYKASSGAQVLGQARSLEALLKNVSGTPDVHDEWFFHAAEILEPLIQESAGQISTGGMSA